MTEFRVLGRIDPTPLTKEFGSLKDFEVIITHERIEHIISHHRQDIDLFWKYAATTIEYPDLILKDEKNPNTVFMIRHLEEINLNVVVRLIIRSDPTERKNSVMTFYRLRQKNLEKLIKQNKTLYKKE